MRSPTLTIGYFIPVDYTTATAVTLVAGGDLGVGDGTTVDLYAWAVYDGTNKDIGISRSPNHDESALTSTTAIGSGSDASNVIYTTSARSNAAIKLLSRITIPRGTATWNTPPTKVTPRSFFANTKNDPVNLTGATADYPLWPGQSAMLNITASSTALRVAVEDGRYDLAIEYDISTFAADQSINLEVNNTTYSNDFTITKFSASVGFATDEEDTVDQTASSHVMTLGLSGSAAISPHIVNASLVISNSGQRSKLRSEFYGTSSGSRVAGFVGSVRNNTPAHTSLGTLNSGEACTGTVYIRRVV
jgi:hypothetical protein